MDVPVTVLEAMQGAKVMVPTPTGNVRVTVPAGCKPGQRLRLRGRGVQRPARPGDLYLVLTPVVPSNPSDDAIRAAEALEEAYGGNVRAGLNEVF
ncbi:MAG: curved DNA-binding protein [Myxococcota bacterium]|jgi:curved DNA-binding protein